MKTPTELTYSDHPARNNRIKALLKLRHPKKYSHLSTLSFAESMMFDEGTTRQLKNRLSARKSREKKATKLALLRRENQQLRDLCWAADTAPESIIAASTPCTPFNCELLPIQHTLGLNKAQIRKMKNNLSARNSRAKLQHKLDTLTQENQYLSVYINNLQSSYVKNEPPSLAQVDAMASEHSSMTNTVTPNSYHNMADWETLDEFEFDALLTEIEKEGLNLTAEALPSIDSATHSAIAHKSTSSAYYSTSWKMTTFGSVRKVVSTENLAIENFSYK